MEIGDKITDCYMYGIGELENIGNPGVIEAAGIDWVIIRDLDLDKPIFTHRSLEELSEFLNE